MQYLWNMTVWTQRCVTKYELKVEIAFSSSLMFVVTIFFNDFYVVYFIMVSCSFFMDFLLNDLSLYVMEKYLTIDLVQD